MRTGENARVRRPAEAGERLGHVLAGEADVAVDLALPAFASGAQVHARHRERRVRGPAPAEDAAAAHDQAIERVLDRRGGRDHRDGEGERHI